MLYKFNNQDQISALPPLEHLKIEESDSPLLMSILVSISLAEATERFAEDNKAFVAYFNGIPAAFGWMAMGKAYIGELNHEFILPLGHRYLWNFRTLPHFRGKGIYPRLLQHILTTERQEASCFWILHAPENMASAKGIEKAGFRYATGVSKVGKNGVYLSAGSNSETFETLAKDLGFKLSEQEAATCWNCSSPYIKGQKRTCCCSEKGKKCSSGKINRKTEKAKI